VSIPDRSSNFTRVARRSRRRGGSIVRPKVLPASIATIQRRLDRLQNDVEFVKNHMSSTLERRLDRLQNDLDFVKNHMSSYLGEGIGLTHLIDETPIYVNTNDFGCPSNFINGGRYEEEYLAVLASFRKPNSVFLDIGANLGVFSLRLAPLMRKGRILAFEPNAGIRELFARSIHLNGLGPLIEISPFGASDRDQEVLLSVPEAHAGGGSIAEPASGATGLNIEVRRLDGLLSNLSHFDIAKIDVEGHELHVLRGMRALIERSQDAIILFEKLSVRSGIEAGLLELVSELGMSIYAIDGSTLTAVDLAGFEARGGYFLAARSSTVAGQYRRNFLCFYPDDLYLIGATIAGGRLIAATTPLQPGAILFHGPYWFLARGTYNLRIDGDIGTDLSLTVAEKFGYPVKELVVTPEARQFDFVVGRDLTQCEIIGRAMSDQAAFSIDALRLTRLG